MRNSNSKPTRKRKVIKRLVLLLILLLLLAAAGYMGYMQLKQEYTVTYDSYTASTGTISNSLSFSGSLQLIDNASYTAEGSATVRDVYVKTGDDVKNGDRLMRLSNGQMVEAEFDGRVNQLSVEAGDKVVAGDALVQVADFEHMQVSIRVDEYDIRDVAVGQACRVTTTATEDTFESVIDDINYISASSGNVAYYTATAYVDVGEGIYPGMQVTVSIPQQEAENVVVLKLDAISFDEKNQAFVYRMGEDETVYPVSIKTGVSNGNYVEITEGLKAGDVVYAEAKADAQDALTRMMTSMFGEQRFNNNRQQNRNFSNMSMPGGFGGGNR